MFKIKNKYLNIAVSNIAVSGVFLLVVVVMSVWGCDQSVEHVSEMVRTVKHKGSGPHERIFESKVVISTFNPFKGFKRGSREDIWGVKSTPGFVIDYKNAKFTFEPLSKGCSRRAHAFWKTRTPKVIAVSATTTADRQAQSFCKTKTTIKYREHPIKAVTRGAEVKIWKILPTPGFIINLESLEKGLSFEMLGTDCSKESNVLFKSKNPELSEVKGIIKASEKADATCKIKVMVKYNERLNIFNLF